MSDYMLNDKSAFIAEIRGFDLSLFTFLTDTLVTLDLGVSIKNG